MGESSTVIAVTFFSLIGLNIIGVYIAVFLFAPATSSRSNPKTNRNTVSQQQRYQRAFPTNHNNNNVYQQRCRSILHVYQQRFRSSRRHPFGCHAPSNE